MDLDALRENLAQIRNWIGPGRKVLTVVKADAYGHGLRQIAAVLMQSGTDLFGVANLAEARAIRSVGPGWPILMLGACLPSEVELAVRDGVMPTLSTLMEAERFAAAAARLNIVAPVQLKLDTGMGRLGVFPEGAEALVESIQRLPSLALKGVYTHYSCAEDSADFTHHQKQLFADLVNSLVARGQSFDWVHASNSGGVLLEPDGPSNVVRVGLLVYGVVPQGARLQDTTLSCRFRPALDWKCRVSLVRDLPAGTPVSYGRTFITPRRMRVATLTVGYADGYSRASSNRAQVLVGNKRCPVLGRVTMDQMMVDVTGLDDVQTGDEAVLIGQQGSQKITANDLAEWSQTIPWEVLTNITYRVPRIYRGGHAA